MTLRVVKIAIALAGLVLINTTAFAQSVQQVALAASQADQSQIERKSTALQTDIGQALKLKKLDRKTADALTKELVEVKTSVASLAKQQGFVSAAENASYQRVFAKVERALAYKK
ncbi:MAG: hypothetical protein EOO63_00090 [Hymenobacter sp.]|nr:MAG: hypothetical protein EOO63_00090 [Hymenobacter sp.]